ncbi:MAG: factor-independent urate hydroxylase [Planctomycetota bacterium]
MTNDNGLRIEHDTYGKSRVRVMKVTRRHDQHQVRELTVEVRLEGSFAATFVDGDNRSVVATDSMKNTVHSLAKDDPIASIEEFGLRLARHFVEHYAQVSKATVEIAETLWERMSLQDGTSHPHAFTRAGGEQATVCVSVQRDGTTVVEPGLRGLVVLKTTDSGFEDFVRDRYTTLADTADRLFATEVTAYWSTRAHGVDFSESRTAARQALLAAFAEHRSKSVQHTLLHMARRMLEACPAMERVTLKLPNLHYLPVDLTPFGQENALEVFVPTSEPHGLIQATVARA